MRKKRKSPAAAICSALGSILLVVIVAGCIALVAPKAFGYHIYTVISGSMEPAIPVGALVYIREVPAEDVEADDVIAFYEVMNTTSITTHRVVSNSSAMGLFVTKGDANETKDMNPIPYDNYIGKVVLTIPVVGGIVQTLTVGSGRLVLLCLVGIAAFLEILSAMLERRAEK